MTDPHGTRDANFPAAGPILAATDLGESGDDAVRQADAFARRYGMQLVVCHVLPELLGSRPLFPQLRQTDRTATADLERRVGELLAQRVETLTGRPSGDYRLALVAGSPHAGILEQADAAGAGLIAVGAGPKAQRVVRHAHCAVLVARPSPRGAVLAATDFSDPSLPALRAGSAEAARRGVPLHVIHSIDTIPATLAPMAYPVPIVTEADEDAIRADALRRLEECLEQLALMAEPIVGRGPAAQSILDEARRLPAELVVVGTRGRTGLARLALGSVAETVTAEAPCSVLAVRLHPR